MLSSSGADFELIGLALTLVILLGLGQRPQLHIPFRFQRAVDPPRTFVYRETYDFSPLKVLVTTALDQAGSETVFKQTIVYSSKQERDDDFDGVATSATEVYANLERYLESSR